MAEYSICKCIRTDKPLKRNGKYPIYLRVRVGFRDTKIPTNLDAFPDQWDKRKNEPKNKALLIQLNKKVRDLNSGYLSLYFNKLHSFFRKKVFQPALFNSIFEQVNPTISAGIRRIPCRIAVSYPSGFYSTNHLYSGSPIRAFATPSVNTVAFRLRARNESM